MGRGLGFVRDEGSQTYNSHGSHEQRPRLTPLQEEVLNDPRRVADLIRQVEHIAASGQSDDFDGDVGPWRGTPIFGQLEAAWNRGMKRREFDGTQGR